MGDRFISVILLLLVVLGLSLVPTVPATLASVGAECCADINIVGAGNVAIDGNMQSPPYPKCLSDDAVGHTFTVQAYPSEGYVFDSWTGNVANPTANPTTVSVTDGGIEKIVANFYEKGDVGPTLVDFGVVFVGGPNPASKMVTVTNVGGGSLDWTSVLTYAPENPNRGWMGASRSPTSGGPLNAGESEIMTVDVDVGDLGPGDIGTYKAYINIKPGVANVILSFTLLPGTVDSGIIYVPDDYPTIQDAVNNAISGDTIIVRDGTYTENVDVGKRLIIRSASGNHADTIVNAADSDDDVFKVSANHVEISGFTIKDATGSNNAGIYLYHADHCTIFDNKVTNNYDGIYLTSSSNDNLIYNNYFDNTNNAYDDGTNTWNIAKARGTNIIDGHYLGGNYWSDYYGDDSIGDDGLGDTLVPYKSLENIHIGGDYLPLVMPSEEGGGDGAAPSLKINLLGETVSCSISDAGEFLEPVNITSKDGLITMNIPRGTVALDKDGKYLESINARGNETAPPPPERAHLIGSAYDITPDGATFNPAMSMTLKYDPRALPEGVEEQNLAMNYYDKGAWEELKSSVNTVDNTVTASASHFTTFAIIGKLILPPPAEFTIANPRLSSREVKPGQEIIVTINVTNIGGSVGDRALNLSINGEVEQNETITLAPQEGGTVAFTIIKDEPGTYSVSLEGLTMEFTVTEPWLSRYWWIILLAVIIIMGLLSYFLVLPVRKAVTEMRRERLTQTQEKAEITPAGAVGIERRKEDKLSKLEKVYGSVRYLDSGGFGEVFLAQTTKGQTIAIKVLREPEKHEEVFFKEFEVWARLIHRNIVRLLRPRLSPLPLFEMEYVDGEDLGWLVERSAPFSMERACRIAFDIVRGVEYAHSSNVVHADLKPRNILLTRTEEVKISDWGLARFAASSSLVKGYTPGYAAPEQVRRGKTSKEIDIYQIGVVFNEILTGDNPFNYGSLDERDERVLTLIPEKPSKYNPRAEPFDDIVLGCLEKAPGNRPEVHEFRQVLSKYMKENYGVLLQETGGTSEKINILCRDAMFAAKLDDYEECLRALKGITAGTSDKEVQERVQNIMDAIEAREKEEREITDEILNDIDILIRRIQYGES